MPGKFCIDRTQVFIKASWQERFLTRRCYVHLTRPPSIILFIPLPTATYVPALCKITVLNLGLLLAPYCYKNLNSTQRMSPISRAAMAHTARGRDPFARVLTRRMQDRQTQSDCKGGMLHSRSPGRWPAQPKWLREKAESQGVRVAYRNTATM